MPDDVDEAELARVERAVRAHRAPASLADLRALLSPAPARRTLQLRLARLVDAGRLRRVGRARATRYVPADGVGTPPRDDDRPVSPPLSTAAAALVERVRRPLATRPAVGYDPDLLFDYRPNESRWLTDADLARLHGLAPSRASEQPAATHARRILDRLLIDLSWNSSRLEGNTYSRLDTRRLLAFGAAAEGRTRLETQMILNHKAAIEFLVEVAVDPGIARSTVLNLHALLADNLLADPDAPGRLRAMPVDIGGSAFVPLEVPQLVEECFERLVLTAAAIDDPFECSLFLLGQIPWLQPFDDVNKRTARLAANLPLVRANLAPLSFVGVAEDDYVAAMLVLYELRDPTALRELFVAACERSATRYAAVRQSVGEPDPFRLRHRETLIGLVGEIVRSGTSGPEALARIRAVADGTVPTAERERFVETAETELLGLHEGNFARFRLRASEYERWRASR